MQLPITTTTTTAQIAGINATTTMPRRCHDIKLYKKNHNQHKNGTKLQAQQQQQQQHLQIYIYR